MYPSQRFCYPAKPCLAEAGGGQCGGNRDEVVLEARSLGASHLRAFLGITLSQIRSSVIACAFFAFIIAFDEVVIASFPSGGEGATLMNLVFASLRNEIDPTIAAISTMMIAVTTIPPLIGHLVLMRRRSTA